MKNTKEAFFTLSTSIKPPKWSFWLSLSALTLLYLSATINIIIKIFTNEKGLFNIDQGSLINVIGFLLGFYLIYLTALHYLAKELDLNKVANKKLFNYQKEISNFRNFIFTLWGKYLPIIGILLGIIMNFKVTSASNFSFIGIFTIVSFSLIYMVISRPILYLIKKTEK